MESEGIEEDSILSQKNCFPVARLYLKEKKGFRMEKLLIISSLSNGTDQCPVPFTRLPFHELGEVENSMAQVTKFGLSSMDSDR